MPGERCSPGVGARRPRWCDGLVNTVKPAGGLPFPQANVRQQNISRNRTIFQHAAILALRGEAGVYRHRRCTSF
jgi:hypothetical protein